MAKIGRHYLIGGRVQGVYFRQSTLQKALAMEITGWVRNLDDGRVEIIAYGYPENMQKFQHWLQKGPPAAKVTQIDIEEIKDLGDEFNEFTIR